jgi:hypothetical protein
MDNLELVYNIAFSCLCLIGIVVFSGLVLSCLIGFSHYDISEGDNKE